MLHLQLLLVIRQVAKQSPVEGIPRLQSVPSQMKHGPNRRRARFKRCEFHPQIPLLFLLAHQLFNRSRGVGCASQPAALSHPLVANEAGLFELFAPER
jgi:hypothetical protein